MSGFESYADFLRDPFNGSGFLLTDEPGYRVWIRDRGDGVMEQCVITHVDPLLDSNAEARANNIGKRWGDGQVVGSVPLDVYFKSGLSEANTQRDKKWIANWWNNSDHQKFRRFEGTV